MADILLLEMELLSSVAVERILEEEEEGGGGWPCQRQCRGAGAEGVWAAVVSKNTPNYGLRSNGRIK